jgi:hypothetical protein
MEQADCTYPGDAGYLGAAQVHATEAVPVLDTCADVLLKLVRGNHHLDVCIKIEGHTTLHLDHPEH